MPEKTAGNPCAVSESAEQTHLFQWAAFESGKYPDLRLLYHIPNGGKRGKAEAARLKMEGVRAGIPDICLPVARGGFHGLYIEMKRIGGRVSPEQKRWIQALRQKGYSAAVCYGYDEAARMILAYLNGRLENVKG